MSYYTYHVLSVLTALKADTGLDWALVRHIERLPSLDNIRLARPAVEAYLACSVPEYRSGLQLWGLRSRGGIEDHGLPHDLPHNLWLMAFYHLGEPRESLLAICNHLGLQALHDALKSGLYTSKPKAYTLDSLAAIDAIQYLVMDI